MFKRTTLAILVSSVAAVAHAQTQLETVNVNATLAKESEQRISQQQIWLQQADDFKSIFAPLLDVGVSDLQTTRSGNNGVNIRGLQENRVDVSLDGITLPEAQESKHFLSYGMEFGRGDFVEPTALRRAEVLYAGSEKALSGSVNFRTLDAQDLLKGRSVGGFVGTGYDSKNRSTYGTAGAAVKAGNYQGLVMGTLRFGNELRNHGAIGGEGALRTKADPADTRSNYVLTKHYFQTSPHSQVRFTFENQFKKVERDLLSKNGAPIDMRSGRQEKGNSLDYIKRHRFSLGHLYQNDNTAITRAESQLYFQNARTENERLRLSERTYRYESSHNRNQTLGLQTDLESALDSSTLQLLRYGLSYTHNKVSNSLQVDRPAYGAVSSRKPSANAKQDKFTAYVEDQIAFGPLTVTPHLGVVHYRVHPTKTTDFTHYGEQRLTKQKETKFTPALGFALKIAPEFEPFLQYTHGVKTPSSEQMSSSFGETIRMGRRVIQVAVVGNPELKSETADNVELGVSGSTDTLTYRVAGYYNQYRNFIDWQDITTEMPGYTQYLQYRNSDKARIHGITASAKWNFYGDFYTNASIAYSKGKAENLGKETPINGIQPLKTQLGLGYEGKQFGANMQWRYTRGKKDKDIHGDLAYNPTQGGYSLFDLSAYWKPVKNLTLTANVNNLFNKKYWDWNDISYLAMLKGEVNTAGNPPIVLDRQNADRFSAPERNVNIGVRYEF